MIRTRKKERCRPYQSTKTFKRSLPRSNSTRRKYSGSRARFGCSRNSKRPGSRPSSFHTNRARKSSNRSTRKTKNCNNYIKRPVWHLHVASNSGSQLLTYKPHFEQYSSFFICLRIAFSICLRYIHAATTATIIATFLRDMFIIFISTIDTVYWEKISNDQVR